jgi:hypothetical protein
MDLSLHGSCGRVETVAARVFWTKMSWMVDGSEWQADQSRVIARATVRVRLHRDCMFSERGR